jgi:hypothetical protein
MRYRGRSHERGGALVEFALVLPAFFVMMLSIMDFGLYFFVQHTLQFATREGARLALVGGTLTDASGNPLSREASIREARPGARRGRDGSRAGGHRDLTRSPPITARRPIRRVVSMRARRGARCACA